MSNKANHYKVGTDGAAKQLLTRAELIEWASFLYSRYEASKKLLKKE